MSCRQQSAPTPAQPKADSSLRLYKYEPLETGHIRLLELLPGRTDEELRCSLIHAPLGQFPEYEALSYCWGDSEPPGYIQCDGERVRITTNLASGVQQVRHHDRSRLLWADQVCINQEDIPERSAQVNMMGDIFKQAQCVILWLGPDDNEATLQAPDVMAIADKLAKLVPKGYSRSIIEDDKLAEYELPPLRTQPWKALQTFVKLPYFSRAWILQEISLASTRVMLWGATVITIPQLHLVISNLWWLGEGGLGIDRDTLINFSLSMAGSQWERGGLGTERSLLSLAIKIRGRKAKEPRDLIFATLGMLEHDRSLITADYSKSLIEVYTTAARFFLQEEPQSLEFLSYAGSQHVNAEKLKHLEYWPSWVPNWTTEHMTGIHEHRFLFSADAKEPHYVAPSSQSKSGPLHLNGIRFEKVSQVSQLAVHGGETNAFATYSDFIAAANFYERAINDQHGSQYALRLIPIVNAFLIGSYNEINMSTGINSAPRPRHEAYEDLIALVVSVAIAALENAMVHNMQNLKAALNIADEAVLAAWLTASADSDFKRKSALGLTVEGQDRPSPDQIKALYRHNTNRSIAQCKQLIERVKAALENANWSSEDMCTASTLIEDLLCVAGDRDRFCTVFTNLDRQRPFFATEHGSFGRGPPTMQSDDVVAILFGAKIPFILRSTNIDGEYRLIGQCYVDGIMHGEYVEKLKAEGTFEECKTTFTLV